MHGMDPNNWHFHSRLPSSLPPSQSEINNWKWSGGWRMTLGHGSEVLPSSHPLYWGLHTWTLPLGRRMLQLQVAFFLLDNTTDWASFLLGLRTPGCMPAQCARRAADQDWCRGCLGWGPGPLLKINGWGFHIGVVTTSHIRTQHPRTFRGHFRDIQPFIFMPNSCSIF